MIRQTPHEVTSPKSWNTTTADLSSSHHDCQPFSRGALAVKARFLFLSLFLTLSTRCIRFVGRILVRPSEPSVIYSRLEARANDHNRPPMKLPVPSSAEDHPLRRAQLNCQNGSHPPPPRRRLPGSYSYTHNRLSIQNHVPIQ
jgi:hypothetical protein